MIWDRGHWKPLGDAGRGLERRQARLRAGRRASQGPLHARAHGRARQAQTRQGQLAAAQAPRSKPAARAQGAAARAHAPQAPRARRIPSEVDGARRGALPAKPSPQLATPVDAPAGRRGLAVRAEARRLPRAVPRRRRRRHGADAARPRLDASDSRASPTAARALPCRSALIDGEAVVFDSHGVTSFQRLQNAIADATASGDRARRVRFAASRRLGSDARAAASSAKRLLEQLLDGAQPAIRYGEHVTEDGAKFFAAACKLGLEGIVAKRAGRSYRAGAHA